MKTLLSTILLTTFLFCSPSWGQDEAAGIEKQFISSVRQLTFEGKRAGEGYYSPDGSLMVFQSERRADNPYFQIYLLDFESGDVEPISPGHGKTTCAWIHPNNNLVLYASTQNDPEARAKQKQEIEFRESGQSRRYSWDYDETYELIAYDRTKKSYTQLTNAKGYDAEGSYSPDGKLIAFASNRNGYSQKLSAEDQQKFDTDPAYMMEIFVMNSDGSNVRQLTDVPGYDGGPFFSPDGKKICWRRFSESGVTAEIMTMDIDGSDQKQLTKIGAMSWAPFFHPSGKYMIFTTNKHGFGNFELYLVAANGNSTPVRVTDTDGFDGLASFTPDGKQLTWTTNRNSKKESQVYLADWNHEAALKALAASGSSPSEEREAFETGQQSAKSANIDFDPRDIMRHVDYLCRKELAGRMTGSAGERKATAYVAAYLDHLGLQPAGDNGTWFQKFDFPDGARLGTQNNLELKIGDETTSFEVNQDWRPLTFSGNVKIDPADVVYAGYGIIAPEQGENEEYDSYVHLDCKDKWVMVYRFMPENVTPERRRFFKKFGELHKKIFYARQQGAKGVIVVSGPNSQVRNQLVALRNDFSPTGSSIAAISVTDDVAQQMLKAAGKDIKQLQDKLDSGDPVMGFNLEGFQVGGAIEIEKITGKGRNVVGRLLAGDTPSEKAVIVGAHIDHLGTGKAGSSLAKQDEENAIHFGADDNASGVAAMLEIAEYLVAKQRTGKLKLKRDIIFAGWSGEELGLYGSAHYTKKLAENAAVVKQEEPKRDASHDFVIGITADNKVLLNGKPAKMSEIGESLVFIAKSYPDFAIEVVAHPDAETSKVEEIKSFVLDRKVKTVNVSVKDPTDDSAKAETGIIAALNMDMVGRLTDELVLQGISSSSFWPGVIERKNAVVGLPLTLSNETDLPTDASSFYRAGIPILSAFTGSHTDYHTPRDTPEKLNYPDAARIARLMGLITRELAMTEELPDFIKQSAKSKEAPRGGLRAYLGSVPSYGEDVAGVKLSDVSKDGPADKAGVKGGDIIVELAGKSIENIYDYTAIIDAIKIGEETSITVMRGGKKVELRITPGSRQ
ncbi:MAG: Tol biopolymer transport system component/Zn-dependent M28 family amino/carboxypeptidase [Mariniblastus sp.]|jgi:Tol biopolymer transport system component/Zn-dependent M28 family amino/carboxypeptidase